MKRFQDILVWLATLGFLVGSIFTFTHILPEVPQCEEDAVIQGVGDYHPTGYWDRYVCIDSDPIL